MDGPSQATDNGRTKSVFARRGLTILVTALAAVVVVAAPVIGFLFAKHGLPELLGEDKPAMSETVRAKPSIAVLTFDNLGNDPAQEFASDGFTDDLITDLSKISGLFVISRNSTFALKGSALAPAAIARELNVRYILTGSFRRSDDFIRINAQLIDAQTGGHVWAERYDETYSSILDVQDIVVREIVTALEVRLTETEADRLARKPTVNLSAYEAFVRGQLALRHYTEDQLQLALLHYNSAIELDPEFADAYAGLAMTAMNIWRFDVESIMPGAVARSIAVQWANRALELDPASGRAHAVKAMLLAVNRNYTDAIGLARHAVELDPGDAEVHMTLAAILSLASQHGDALAQAQEAFRHDPKPPSHFYGRLGVILFFNDRYEEALSALEKNRILQPPGLPMELAMVYAALGRTNDARLAVETLLRQKDFANQAFYRVLYAHHLNTEDLNKRLSALEAAGLPAWPYNFRVPNGRRLTGEEISALMFGKTVKGRYLKENMEYIEQIGENGALAHRNMASMLVGNTTVQGDMYCQKFQARLLGRWNCGPIFENPRGHPETENQYVYINALSVREFAVVE